MYENTDLKINSLDDFLLDTLELEINNYCNMACEYCFLKGGYNTNDTDKVFTRWNELLDLLKNINISEDFTVGFSTGELFLDSRVNLVYNAIKKIDKIKRYKCIDISYRFFSNGTNYKNIIEVLELINDPKSTMSISYDGELSARHIKPGHLNEVRDNLEELANTKYKDNIIIRYAIYGDVSDFFDTMKYLYDLGYKHIEYYFVDYWDGYKDKDFINTFTEELYKVLNFFKDKESDFYNIWKYNNEKNPRPTCLAGTTLAINASGRMGVCSTSLNDKLGLDYDSISIDMANYKDIPRLFNMFDKDYILDRTDIGCNKCTNQLCEDCCSYRSICANCNIESRKFQQCAIHNAELEVYNKIFKEG